MTCHQNPGPPNDNKYKITILFVTEIYSLCISFLFSKQLLHNQNKMPRAPKIQCYDTFLKKQPQACMTSLPRMTKTRLCLWLWNNRDINRLISGVAALESHQAPSWRVVKPPSSPLAGQGIRFHIWYMSANRSLQSTQHCLITHLFR